MFVAVLETEKQSLACSLLGGRSGVRRIVMAPPCRATSVTPANVSWPLKAVQTGSLHGPPSGLPVFYPEMGSTGPQTYSMVTGKTLLKTSRFLYTGSPVASGGLLWKKWVQKGRN